MPLSYNNFFTGLSLKKKKKSLTEVYILHTTEKDEEEKSCLLAEALALGTLNLASLKISEYFQLSIFYSVS